MVVPIGRIAREQPFQAIPAGDRRIGAYLRLNRIQLGGGILIAVLLPVLLRQGPQIFLPEVLSFGSAEYALVGTFCALIAGYVLLREFSGFPTVRTASYVIPSFLAAYGIVALIFFFWRIDYSRFQFAVSFLAAIIWFYSLHSMYRKDREPRLALVPGGEDQGVTDIRGARWQRLSEPDADIFAFDGVVADLRADFSPDWQRFIAKCVLSARPVYHVKQITESLTGQVAIEHLSENSFGSVLPSSFYLKIKRLADFAMAVALLPFILPVIAITAVLIKIESGGPVFFCQSRMGYQGKPFTIYKLRSMRHDMDDERRFTLEQDPRVTRIGRLIRKYRIDELPQIFNILKGEMSWIGPRPEAVELAEWYERDIPFYAYRHAVRPGISGWAQINQGNVAEIDAATAKLHYDFYYIKHFSPSLDLLIVIKTIKTILTGFGSR